MITPNPKTSGGARWNHLAAYGYALRQPGGSPATAKDYLVKLYKNVPVLDPGARSATTTFVERGIGDVLLAWENGALLALRELGPNKFEIVAPSISILAEQPWSTRTSTSAAPASWPQAYLEFLYTDEGQEIVAKNYYRPVVDRFARKYASQFPNIKLFPMTELGGWMQAQKAHFADGGLFDQIYQPGR